MKAFIFLAVLGLTQASINWDNVIPIRKQLTPPNDARLPEFNPRIVGGHEAEPNSIPYQVALFINAAGGTYFCGGSLISTEYVLTAAHCIDSDSIPGIKSIDVILGAHEVKGTESTQQIIVSTEFKKHERYVSSAVLDDIGIVKLSTPAILNENVQIISLPTESDKSNTYEGVVAQVSGWGKTSDGASGIAEKLQVVESDIISNDLCNSFYFGSIRSGHICLNGERYESPCNGDSGGPLVYEGKQIGIVSFGIIFGCQVGFPGAFTRVTEYIDWIAENMN